MALEGEGLRCITWSHEAEAPGGRPAASEWTPGGAWPPRSPSGSWKARTVPAALEVALAGLAYVLGRGW